MMKYLQRIGKSLMLPVACLPAAGILYGIGYWIDPVGWGANSVTAAFCIKAASAIIDQIPILFALGVSIGMASDRDGTPALAGVLSHGPPRPRGLPYFQRSSTTPSQTAAVEPSPSPLTMRGFAGRPTRMIPVITRSPRHVQ